MNKCKKFLNYLDVKKYSFSGYRESVCKTPVERNLIFFISKGSAEVFQGEDFLQVNEGEMIYIPKGSAYTIRWCGEPKIKIYNVFFDFFSDYTCDNKILKFKYDKKVFKNLYNSYEKNFFYATGIFYKIYGDISENLDFYEETKEKNPILGALKFIEENCDTDFDIKTLAQLFNLSESRFYELFKKHTGFTPIDYKNNCRIKRAKIMLSDEKNTAEDISRSLGFSSPSYFRRVFKSQTGKTPSEYRNTLEFI